MRAEMYFSTSIVHLMLGAQGPSCPQFQRLRTSFPVPIKGSDLHQAKIHPVRRSGNGNPNFKISYAQLELRSAVGWRVSEHLSTPTLPPLTRPANDTLAAGSSLRGSPSHRRRSHLGDLHGRSKTSRRDRRYYLVRGSPYPTTNNAGGVDNAQSTKYRSRRSCRRDCRGWWVLSRGCRR